ncbi:MAG TPA: hypothetical protein VIJ94_06100, partial [Caulobacteraceae bacterium]
MIGWKPFDDNAQVASTRYRTLWPLAELRRRDFPVTLYHEAAEGLYSAVIVSKRARYEDLLLARKLKQSGRLLIFDICDNHFYNPQDLPDYAALRRRLRVMMQLADLVVCSTSPLRDILAEELDGAKRPVIVGDPFEAICLPPGVARPERPVLLWFGSHGSPNAASGMFDILHIADELAALYRETAFELLVLSNSREKYRTHIEPLPFPTRYAPWDQATFPSYLASASAVVIPLSKNPFVACKTHNRMSIALYAGVPVVADGIYSYREFSRFCFIDDWAAGLRTVLNAPQAARARLVGAREYLDAMWSIEVIATQWADVLK